LPSLQIRELPENLYEKICALAKKERRSITQQTIILLEKALEMENQRKTNRQILLDQIIQETQTKYNFSDPVRLIREDREK